MTGYGQPDDRARAFEAGFDDHVVKPVSVEELSAAIERMRSKKIAGKGRRLAAWRPRPPSDTDRRATPFFLTAAPASATEQVEAA